MRRLLLLSVVVLSLPGVGCQLLLTGPRNVVFEICDRTGNLAEKCRDLTVLWFAPNVLRQALHGENPLQVTRRLSHGFTNTTTYVFSKAMGDVGTSPDPNNRRLTKTLQTVDQNVTVTSREEDLKFLLEELGINTHGSSKSVQ